MYVGCEIAFAAKQKILTRLATLQSYASRASAGGDLSVGLNVS